ncbi:DDX49 helicase, partial [Hypocryptadius cinnamomeus]|nr:DDX49 helicase [Hypocryptadius cinnamomeus]
MAEFRALGLAPWLAEQARQVGLLRPTPVQAACIPAVLQGRDCLGCAQTGSGKTAAFVLPVLHALARDPYGIFCLVLTPTRELAYQIAEQFRVLGKPLGLKDCVVVGGLGVPSSPGNPERFPGRIPENPEGFPSSLGAFLGILLGFLNSLVLDEADRLLEQGSADFSADLELILGAVPARRQTLLFSATLTATLSQLRALAANSPFFWEATSQPCWSTLPWWDSPCLSQLSPDPFPQCILRIFLGFSLPSRDCQVLNMMLRRYNFPSVALHSMMKQKQRFAALAKFKSSIFKILIATDVAARGLDIPAVQVVINHNTPGLPKIYIHRVGRTARAGRKGMAITLVTQYDIHLVHAIEEEIKLQLQEFSVEEQLVLDILTQVNVTRRECEIVSV